MVRDQVHNFGKLAILLLRQLGTMHGDDIRGRWYLHPKPLLPFRAGSASGACEKKTKPRPLKGVNGRTSGGGSRVKCCLQAGLRRFDVKKSVQDDFNTRIDERLQRMPIRPDVCSSYYLDEGGRNHFVWPEFGVTIKRQLENFSLADYDIR